MKKKFAIALRLTMKIAVMPAHGARVNSPYPVASRMRPMIRWIQPQALVSRSNV